MGNRRQGFKAKALERAIEKLGAGEPLDEKESALCVKILSKKLIKDAAVDTSRMDGFWCGWRHLCPACGAEAAAEAGDQTVCACGQMLRLPPFSEWKPAFAAGHVWDEKKEKWTEGAPEAPEAEAGAAGGKKRRRRRRH